MNGMAIRLMDEEMNDRFEQNQPLCRFGPGGDFISEWPPRTITKHAPNSLTKVLASIAETLGLLIGAEPGSALAGAIYTGCTRDFSGMREEDTQYAVEHGPIDTAADTTPDADPQGDSLFPGESILFTDHCGAGRRAKHKPQHGIRAHRRTAKKRPAPDIARQGTLFDFDFKRARTA